MAVKYNNTPQKTTHLWSTSLAGATNFKILSAFSRLFVLIEYWRGTFIPSPAILQTYASSSTVSKCPENNSHSSAIYGAVTCYWSCTVTPCCYLSRLTTLNWKENNWKKKNISLNLKMNQLTRLLKRKFAMVGY